MKRKKVQRIPNPVSDLNVILRVFKDIYGILYAHGIIEIDDISRALVATNNVTSHGAIGQVALERSTIPERGLDGMYNQSKALAELFRVLGWMQSTTKRLLYSMTPLGAHIVSASNPAPLMRECLLGIVYPSEVIDTKGNQNLRLFGCILQVMLELGSISRDEMMAGPMSISDDTDTKLFKEMVASLKDCRANPKRLNALLLKIAKNRGITVQPTMGNYSRFPMAAIPWTDWGKKDNKSVIYITPAGRSMALLLQAGNDIRLNDFNRYADLAKPALIRFGFFSMLLRAGFDMSCVAQQMEKDRALLLEHKVPCRDDMYFSPFQQLSRTSIEKWTPDFIIPIDRPKDKQKVSLAASVQNINAQTKSRFQSIAFRLIKRNGTAPKYHTEVADQLSKLIKRYPVDDAVERMADYYAATNKDVFYPLIADLFCIIGFNCRISRAGQNYERSDAIILDPKYSIPIEIKSPGEEMEMSVKGVRQALENKTVLLARKSYRTDKATTSLVVGYNSPNPRSEVHELITDMFNTYGVRIGIIDFRSLVRLALLSIKQSKRVVIPDFRLLQGVLHVENV